MPLFFRRSKKSKKHSKGNALINPFVEDILDENDKLDAQQSYDICAICLDRKQCPAFLVCAHSFCESCLLAYLRFKNDDEEEPGPKVCPLCRTIIYTDAFKEPKSWFPKYSVALLGVLSLGAYYGFKFFLASR